MMFPTVLVASAMAFAAPVSAMAQAVTTFDGTYGAVSGITGQGGTVNCPPVRTPAPLTISSGVIKSMAPGNFQGTVTPAGHVVLHTGDVRFEGKIENDTLKAGGGTGRCTIYFTWQKR